MRKNIKSANSYLLFKVVGSGCVALGGTAAWARGEGFCDIVAGVWITPFKAPTIPLIASWLAGSAPIIPPTPGTAGMVEVTVCIPLASAPTVTPLTCWTPVTPEPCWAGLCPAGGGVERADELLVLCPLEVISWCKNKQQNPLSCIKFHLTAQCKDYDELTCNRFKFRRNK